LSGTARPGSAALERTGRTDPLWGGEDDADEDGIAICDGDCDDSNADIFPGAEEICDRVDNDCDGDTACGEAS
jgi:hypothetical protein